MKNMFRSLIDPCPLKTFLTGHYRLPRHIIHTFQIRKEYEDPQMSSYRSPLALNLVSKPSRHEGVCVPVDHMQSSNGSISATKWLMQRRRTPAAAQAPSPNAREAVWMLGAYMGPGQLPSTCDPRRGGKVIERRHCRALVVPYCRRAHVHQTHRSLQ